MHKAFIFGTNYKGTQYELFGCVNDCKRIQNTLATHGFKIDTYISETPLSKGILEGRLRKIVTEAMPGDRLVLFYSGHGTQVKDTSNDEPDGLDEAIYLGPDGLMTDDVLNLIITHAKPGVKIWTIFDCCHSGTMMDLPHTYTNGSWDPMVSKDIDLEIICISGCMDPQVSYESNGEGYLTNALIKCMKGGKRISWKTLFDTITSEVLIVSGGLQYPVMSTSKKNMILYDFIL